MTGREMPWKAAPAGPASAVATRKPRRPPEEKTLQTYAVAELMKLAEQEGILFAGDMSGSRRTRAEQLWAKNTGLVAGEPDLRVYGPRGRVLFIEMKRAGSGEVSAAQHARHDALRALGHVVIVIWAATGAEAAAKVRTAVLDWLAA